MKSKSINVIVYKPTDSAGVEELAKRVAEIHAEHVIHRIRSLTCPIAQKKALLDAVIGTVRQRQKETPVSKNTNHQTTPEANKIASGGRYTVSNF